MQGGSGPASDSWDEVWDAYEARRAATEAAAAALQPLPLLRPAPAAARGWLRSVLVAAAFGLGCAAGSTWPLLGLYALVARQDAPGLLRQVDMAPAAPGLRLALRAHAGLGSAPSATGAERLLAGMADEMAAALARPGALAALVEARGQEGWPLRDPAAPSLPLLRPVGRGGLSLDLAPAEGVGGFGLDLAWNNGWQAVAVRLLDAPAGTGTAAGQGVQAALRRL
jgi:hypothetical protein